MRLIDMLFWLDVFAIALVIERLWFSKKVR
jgi:hypothetical protein